MENYPLFSIDINPRRNLAELNRSFSGSLYTWSNASFPIIPDENPFNNNFDDILYEIRESNTGYHVFLPGKNSFYDNGSSLEDVEFMEILKNSMFGLISSFTPVIPDGFKVVAVCKMIGDSVNLEDNNDVMDSMYLKLGNIELNNNTTVQQVKNTMETMFTNKMNVISNDYNHMFFPNILYVYITKPTRINGGCHDHKTSIITINGKFMVKNHRSIKSCFFACIIKFFNFKANQKIPYYDVHEFSSNEPVGEMFFSATCIRKFMNYPFNELINLEQIREIMRLFRMDLEIFDENGNILRKYLFSYDSHNQWNGKIPKILYKDDHYMEIIKFVDNRKCPYCLREHGENVDLEQCFINLRSDNVNALFEHRINSYNFIGHSNEKLKIHLPLVTKKVNQVTKRFESEVPHLNLTCFYDFETFVDHNKSSDFWFSCNKKHEVYAVGLSISDVVDPKKESLKINYYGKNCMSQFFGALKSWAQDVFRYYKVELRKKSESKKSIELVMISFNGSGFDHFLLIEYIINFMSEEIVVSPESFIFHNGRILDFKFKFKDLLSSEPTSVSKKKKTSVEENYIYFRMLDFGRHVNGSLDSVAKSFKLTTRKTVFPHSVIKSWNDVYDKNKIISWKSFNPKDYNDLSSREFVQKQYGLSDLNSTSSIDIETLLLEYLTHDVSVLRESYTKYGDEILKSNNMNISSYITASQMAYSNWLMGLYIDTFKKIPEHVRINTTEDDFIEGARNFHKIDKLTKEILLENIPTLPGTLEIRKLIMLAMTGGRTFPKKRIYISKQFRQILEHVEINNTIHCQYDSNSNDGIRFINSPDINKSNFDYDLVDDFLAYVDINSLYPACLTVENGYPMGEGVIATPEQIRNINLEIQSGHFNSIGFFYCLVDSQGYRTMPLVPGRVGRANEKMHEGPGGKLVWCYGKQYVMLPSITIEYLIQTSYLVKVFFGVIYPSRGHPFRDFIIKNYNERVVMKKEGNAVGSLTKKTYMNSSYGKTVQGFPLDTTRFIYNNQDWTKFNSDNYLDDVMLFPGGIEVAVGKTKTINDKILFNQQKPCQIGNFVTAYGRLFMQLYFDILDPSGQDEELSPYYTDTDSFFVPISQLKKTFGDDLKKEYEHDILPNFKLKIDNDELGCLKLEYPDKKIVAAFFLRPKTYALIMMDKKGNITYDFKTKGIPSSSTFQKDVIEFLMDPNGTKSFDFFQMNRTGIRTQPGAYPFEIKSSISSRKINGKGYDGFELNGNNFRTMSSNDMIDKFGQYRSNIIESHMLKVKADLVFEQQIKKDDFDIYDIGLKPQLSTDDTQELDCDRILDEHLATIEKMQMMFNDEKN